LATAVPLRFTLRYSERLSIRPKRFELMHRIVGGA